MLVKLRSSPQYGQYQESDLIFSRFTPLRFKFKEENG